MNNINVVVVGGRLTKDFEPLRSQSGVGYGTFSIASGYYDTQSKSEKANFFDISVVGHNAEFVSKYAKKGTSVVVSGSMRQRQYQDKNGNTRNTIVIECKDIQLEKPSSSVEQQNQVQEQEQVNDFIKQNQNRVAEVETTNDITDDDLPF